MSVPELHRPLRLSRIGADGLQIVVESNEAERAALARRMLLPAIPALRCRFALTREGRGVIAASGRLDALVVQNCVVSLEDFEAPVTEDFTVHFVPAGTETDDPDPESIDEIPYEGDSIDLGEATAEQLALALDPYPRRPGIVFDEAEEPSDPRLAALLALRDAKDRDS
jgi:uncharacterized metal-binding protein YceD (DUF177 family)